MTKHEALLALVRLVVAGNTEIARLEELSAEVLAMPDQAEDERPV